jgi:glycerate kinase
MGGADMRIIIAPDKFKGSLSAVDAAEAIGRGVTRARPDAEVVLLPVADGGEGTVAAAVAAGYTRHVVTVDGPTGEPVEASFAVRGEAAVIEMAEASGLRILPGHRPAPLSATTYGTGQLVTAALDAGARHIVLGIGGSATTDGGAGLAQALGVRLLDRDGAELARGGAALADLDRIDASGLDPRVGAAEFTVASDVDNPLVGPQGAAAIYGPQKGASPQDVAVLDAALGRYAKVLQRDVGMDVADVPGAGAAGGLGAGALAFLGAELTSGIGLLLDVVGFSAAVQGASLVITGEGSFDDQTLSGKAPVGVARAAANAGIPVVALVGRLAVTPEQLAQVGISGARAVLELEPDLGRAQTNAAALLAELAAQMVADQPRAPR